LLELALEHLPHTLWVKDRIGIGEIWRDLRIEGVEVSTTSASPVPIKLAGSLKRKIVTLGNAPYPPASHPIWLLRSGA